MNTFWAIREFGGRSLTGDVTVEQPYFDLFDDENDARAIFFTQETKLFCQQNGKISLPMFLS